MKEENIPYEFLCPISMGVMRDPVICDDGHTYDRICIEAWLENNGRSPLTNQVLPTAIVKANEEQHM